ncbi:MAG: tol-pal system YbgF family protein [Sandaracinaceae bacterium]
MRATPLSTARSVTMLALRVAAAIVVAAAMIPSAAEAQWGRAPNNDAQAMQTYNEGVAAYNEARFADAAALFEQAYTLSPRPLLLFNLANAQERAELYAEAAANLRRYQSDAPIDEHAALAERISNLERLASGGDGGGGGSSDLLLPGVIMGAVGVAMIAAGVVFGVLALDAGAGITDGDDPACRRLSDERLLCRGGANGLGDYETFALVADIGLIGGGVVAAAGLALIVVSLVTGGEDSATAWTPQIWLGPDGAGAGMGGRF